MKQFLISLAFLTSLVAGFIFIIALPRAEKNVEIILTDFGFETADVKKSQFTLTGMTFDLIQLDEEGFSTIKNLKVTLFWPTYFMTRSIDKIEIESLEISALPREFKNFININFGTPPADFINIQNITLDIAIADKALHFKGALNISKQEGGQYNIVGNMNAAQPEISFDGKISGALDTQTPKFNLDGEIEEFNITSTPLTINRGNGWLSYQSNTQKNISAQMDAGSGSVFNIPAKNLSLIIGQTGLTYPILFRANAAGMDGVKLTSDLIYAADHAQRNFDATLQIENMDKFLEGLKLQNVIAQKPNTDIKKLESRFVYVPEKRFAGGPLPFDLSINTKLLGDLNGTFLIYPDSLDMRGTASGSGEVMNLLQTLFPIPDKNMNGNTMRLDGNLKSLLD